MKRTRLTSVTAVLAAMTLASFGTATAASADPDAATIEWDSEGITAQQDLLHDQWAAAMLEDNPVEMQRLEAQMRGVGIEFVTEAHVFAEHPELATALPPSGPLRATPPAPGVVTPQVALPPGGNVRWTSSRVKYTYAGKRYEVQTLTALPTGNSNLRRTGSATTTRSGNWRAGTTNLMKAAVGAAAGTNPWTAVTWTLFDVASGFVPGLKTTTVVTDVRATYTWAMTTTAQFRYVKLDGTSDSNQGLGFVSTKVQAVVGYQVPHFVTSGGTSTPRLLQKQSTINTTPTCYSANGSYNAVRSYLNLSGARTCFAAPITITGVQNRAITTLRAIQPQFPAHVF